MGKMEDAKNILSSCIQRRQYEQQKKGYEEESKEPFAAHMVNAVSASGKAIPAPLKHVDEAAVRSLDVARKAKDISLESMVNSPHTII